MNANGKKTGFRVAALFAMAGATMAMAAGPSSSEGVALDDVVMVNKDAPQQQGSSGGSSDRTLFDDSFIGDSFIGGGILGGEFIGGVVEGSVTGDGSTLGNTNGNSLGNTNGNQTGD